MADNTAEVEALYPEGSTPEIRVPKVSSLCSYGMRPHVMTGLLRQLLLQHFVDPANIEEPRLRKRFEQIGAWRPSENGEYRTGILIESITKWQPQDNEKRLAIVIKRNDWAFRRIAIADLAETDYLDGTHYYTGMWDGSHTLFALAYDGAETELLATEVARLMLHYGSEIAEQMDLHRYLLAQVGALQPVKGVTDAYAVPVTVAYTAQESWALVPHAPRTKRIVFRASELLG